MIMNVSRYNSNNECAAHAHHRLLFYGNTYECQSPEEDGLSEEKCRPPKQFSLLYASELLLHVTR